VQLTLFMYKYIIINKYLRTTYLRTRRAAVDLSLLLLLLLLLLFIVL
jgi:hypothetical protein